MTNQSQEQKRNRNPGSRDEEAVDRNNNDTMNEDMTRTTGDEGDAASRDNRRRKDRTDEVTTDNRM